MTGRPGRRTGAGLRRCTALAVSALMVGTLLQTSAVPVVAADGGRGRPALPAAEKPVAGAENVRVKPRKAYRGPKTPQQAPEAAWPKAGEDVVELPEPEAGDSAVPAPEKAEGMPIALGVPAVAGTENSRVRTRATGPAASGEVETRVLGRKQTAEAGVDGLLFTLALEDGDAGKTGVTVDYSSFAQSYGGGYASRLTLVELPECALTTPEEEACSTPRPIPTANDTERRRLTAGSVTLRSGTPTVLAAVADDKGMEGDYKATQLSPSATWRTDLNTGDFTWSYEMPVPEVPGGLKPNVGLSYSSGAIDGRTGSTNNQSSWAGDGFDLWPGHIERRYKPCADDGVENADGNKPGDLCWGYDNAFLSFNGKGGELVPAGTDTWKLRQDDGTRIKRLTSAERGNGDDDGEYWEATTPDGTRYYFGHNRLPGWASGKETTDSTWTVPVFGDDSGEPCHASSFAGSWCRQAWRWNLDYVVDRHGNAVAYYYDKETNSYGRNLKKTDDTRYDRGGHLDRIEYGLRSADPYADKPPARVDFTSSERCLPETGVTCAPDTIDDKAFHWYDTPWDLNCDAGEDCDRRLSPTFWTRKRLTEVSTHVLKADGTYGKADSWTLGHRWGMADIDYQLLLDSVQHTGHTATPAVTLPKTTFAYTQRENRLDRTGDGYAPFVKERLSTVADESGGRIDVNYSAPACDAASPPTPRSNTTRCFPQYIGGSATDDPELHWFNKYVVTSVTATDRTGGAPDQVTRYDYLGGAAWHYDDDDGLTREKHRTWSQWRGYGHVRVRTGGQDAATVRTQQDHYFLRGMHGDRARPDGGEKTVTVSLGDDEGDPITDHESVAGFAYKTVTHSGPGGRVLAKTVNRPWHHETARKVRDWGTVTANLTGTSHTRTWTSLDDGAGDRWRVTSTATEYDTVAGRAIEVDDRADDSTAADDQCTRTTYATNTDRNILNLPARVETVAKSCGTAPDRARDVISDVRTAYDGGAYGAAPTRGDNTATATLEEHDGTRAVYLESGATFDSYGRPLTSTDLTADVTVQGSGTPVRAPRSDGRTTTTVYSPATGLPAKVTETSPPAAEGDSASALTTTTELEPLRGLPSAVHDTNGVTTTFAYDALGRTSRIWLADRPTSAVPDHQFSYTVTEDRPVAVATRTPNNQGGQYTAYTIYDGFLRERQTQAPGPDGGRILTDVFYDERGLTARTHAPYYAEGDPGTGLFALTDALSVETQTHHTHDGLGRETEARQIAGNGDGGTVLNVTKTLYGGDRTTVIPPEGATATTTLTDARGRTTELRQHHHRAADAPYDAITYRHTPRGELAEVTDAEGNTWQYTYDQLGRKVRDEDPDRGVTKSTYDDRGLLTSTEDARGTVLVNRYDGLDRRIELREGSAAGALRAKWVYDTVSGARGHLAEATRYHDGNAYTSKVTMYDKYYRAVRTAVVIPPSEGELAGTYQAGTAYKLSGLVGAVSYSAAGSLPGGGVTHDFDDRTLWVTSSFGRGFDADVSHSLTGRPLQYALGSSGSSPKAWVTNTYEWGTRRLATSRVDRQDVNGVDRHSTYRYDPAGNVLSVADVSRSGTDNQCFAYDHLRRLTEAWTQPIRTCATAPEAGVLGGPAPYWHSYTYDKTGNRRTETRHDTGGDPGRDVRRTYEYPDPGSPRPHTLTSVTTTGPTGTARDGYGYDATGNTATRTLGGDTQKLDWDAEGHLAKVTEPVEGGADKVTEYLYDADGNRLIGRTPTETTLYLGHTEITLAKGATKPKATRYADLGGGHQAVIEDDGTVSFTVADHHGTGHLAVKADDLSLTQRRTLPFGGPRGEQPGPWPGTRGFVGGTTDTATGLTHLGAREYDPGAGRFVSVDPIMDLADPQQMHGYSYANNNPLTWSDPTGLRPDGPVGGNGVADSYYYKREGKQGSGWFGDRYGGWSYRHVQFFPGPIGSKKDGYTVNYTWSRKAQSRGVGKKDGQAYRSFEREQPKGVLPLVMGTVGSIILPDLHEWENCFGGSVSGCAWAATDLPVLKVFKTGRLLQGRKADAAAENATTCARGRHSFLAGTDVLMADGSTKDIEDVTVGDKVIATDPETGETREREVVATILTEDDKAYVDLSVTTEDGTGTLTTTGHHPFWSESDRAWVDAADLTPGTALRTDDGTTATLQSIRTYTDHQDTYNLTVADLHTYYVLAGETPVLVHNSNCPLTGGFKVGVTPDEIADINRGFGGETLLSGSPANTMANASRYNSFWDKSAVVIRDIAGGHMFNNGNKRTAQAVVEQLMQRNNVTSGPTSADLRGVIDRVGKGQLHDVSDISAALRGY
ncbi:sugar-binding protein [Streptomyces carminius]|uniref:Sugar-binding protein n=1 Tax=Streptomyces carminius TaxID=2665496 RepID=A0A2M8LYX9_9ACTN|nr:polymorphic toxin-type HINT domain-containing protein [Streptomyces carminius]PJE97183.1 sugar-binding protein [Streptomyces carminius]